MPTTRTFQCYDCQHQWSLPYATGRPAECPSCHGGNFCRLEAERGGARAAGAAGPGGRCRCGQKQG